MNSFLKYTIFILSFSKIHEAYCSHENGSLEANVAQEIEPGPSERFKAENDVKFLLYTQKNPTEATTISVGDASSLGNFNAAHETNIIVHGWLSSPSHFDDVRSGYISTGEEYNIILVDWSKGAENALYPVSRGYVVSVGEFVATLLDFLVERGLDASRLHLVGHSLGAHIAGVAGNRMNKGKAGRLTGLDPAGPLFGLESSNDRLNKGDASHVDVIHTCAGVLGWNDPMGDADFYPNGGKMVQPGCGEDTAELGLGSCSHSRSRIYFAESITTKVGFVGVQCADWKTYESGSCSSNPKALMGETTPTNTEGTYFLKTASSSPFAEG